MTRPNSNIRPNKRTSADVTEAVAGSIANGEADATDIDVETETESPAPEPTKPEELLPEFCKAINKDTGITLCVKRLFPGVRLPERTRTTDAGFDLFAAANPTRLNGSTVGYRTGIAVAIPARHVGLICERSSVYNYGVKLIGGVIDEGYTGEITVLFKHIDPHLPMYAGGDKIAQLLIIPIARITEIQEVDDLGETDRGDKGFGSSGN